MATWQRIFFANGVFFLTAGVAFDVLVVGQPGLSEGLTFLQLQGIGFLLIALYLKERKEGKTS